LTCRKQPRSSLLLSLCWPMFILTICWSMRCVRRCGGGLIWRALAALQLATASFILSSPADAEDSAASGEVSETHSEVWSGAQAYGHVWSLYSGAAVAPFGSIRDDGWRVRAVAGYGADRYSGPRAVGAGPPLVFTFKGTGSFADLLLGYHQQLGPVTLKAYAGVSLADRQVTPNDPESLIHGTGLGGKIALETWWNLSDQAWTSIDVSWGSLYRSYAGRARLGWRLTPALSLGLEAGAAGNLECDILRAGGFLRYEWTSGELSLSGGASNDKLLDSGGPAVARSSTPFVTLSWLTRF
jgi:hypothetical protein